MKKYKKPIIDTTTGLDVDSFMVTATIGGDPGPGTGGPGSGGGDAKIREDEVVEEEAMIQLLIDHENGTSDKLW